MIGRTWSGTMSSLLGSGRAHCAADRRADSDRQGKEGGNLRFSVHDFPLIGDDQLHPHVVVAAAALTVHSTRYCAGVSRAFTS